MGSQELDMAERLHFTLWPGDHALGSGYEQKGCASLGVWDPSYPSSSQMRTLGGPGQQSHEQGGSRGLSLDPVKPACSDCLQALREKSIPTKAQPGHRWVYLFSGVCGVLPQVRRGARRVTAEARLWACPHAGSTAGRQTMRKPSQQVNCQEETQGQ